MLSKWTYYINPTQYYHQPKTQQEVDTFCKNAKKILEEYILRQEWNIKVVIRSGSPQLLVGQEEADQSLVLNRLLEHIEKYDGSFDKKLNTSEVLNSFPKN